MIQIDHIPRSLVDILRWRAIHQPDRIGYEFLEDGESLVHELTYQALDQRARDIAAGLQRIARPGERALLFLPPGLDFIAAYFGCLYGNVISVPVHIPHLSRLDKTLSNQINIAANAGCTIAVVNSAYHEVIRNQDSIRSQFGKMEFIVADSSDLSGWGEHWQAPEIQSQDIAFLQYTSGSTTSPKGVIVSHGNLLHNLQHIEHSFGQTTESKAVIWLPPFHDMGLIGGILQPLYLGNLVTLMPPWTFLQKPLRWLQAISARQATTSGGPNFAYELCLNKIKPEQRDQLDLSHWEVAFNGAEPINPATLERFSHYFAPCGFRKEAFTPCYGLAEATLRVTGGPKSRPVEYRHLLKSSLKHHRVAISQESGLHTVTVVGCGQDMQEQRIRIVDPESHRPCQPQSIGEIWVSGPSVAQGYWNMPQETDATFGARLSDTDDGPYMRTGDLGFIHEGELFVTGRIKNLIIIDGKNHYPHDIEVTVAAAHPAVLPSGCAVFAITESDTERIIVLAEVNHRGMEDPAAIKSAISRAVNEVHEVHVHDVQLGLAGTIPRTTSGKIKHFLCKQDYLSGKIQEFAYP